MKRELLVLAFLAFASPAIAQPAPTGEMLPMKVVDQGIEKVRVGAAQVDARRYLVKSQMDVTFWYDAAGRWVKCAFATQGSKVEYVLRGPANG